MSTKKLTLIVDDEPDIRELLEITLRRMELECNCCGDIVSAKRCLAKGHYDLCLTDMRLPDGDGLDLVAYIQQHHPDLPVAVITAHGSMETAIRALRSGAFDFITKPIDLKILRELVSTALKVSSTSTPAQSQRMIGDSPAMQQLRQTITKLARSQAPVSIGGESGTGKELVARLIHELGPRASHPFIPVNCGAIPEELMESEFFGHKKGSFSGAVADKAGLFQAAQGGTLFLDEVAELPLHMQVKMLRAIQEKSIRPIGAQTEQPVDVRILSATHKDLEALVDDGHFRQDLYYRIVVIKLQVPSLRERVADLKPLVQHLLGIHSGNDLKPMGISPAAIVRLRAYPFPGNVRELENILERAMTLCDGNIIGADDLQLPELATEPAKAHEHAAPNSAEARESPAELPENQALGSYMDEVARHKIELALEQTRWNKTAAAKLLGISLRALRYRMNKLDLK